MIYLILTDCVKGKIMQKKILIAVLACVAAAAVAAAAFVLPQFEKSEKTDFLMNTVVTAKLEGKGSEETAQKIMNKISELEAACFSRTAEGSDIYRLNKDGAANISRETADVLIKALEVCKKSSGSFDITLAKVSDLWNASAQSKTLPDSEKLRMAVETSGFEKLSVDEDNATLQSGAGVDLGSVGKGAACDSATKLLEDADVSRAVVSIGGSILLYGEGDFTVGIASPEKGSSDYIAVLTLPAGCVSTSGTYERYFDLGSERYHHILDSQTGYPVDNGLVSVTVCSQDGLLSDALSTACFVLGVEEGMKLANDYGCEAVFVTDSAEIYATDGIADSLEVTDSGYILV